jgi:integrase
MVIAVLGSSEAYMTTWKKTRFVGVRVRESKTRRHRGKPERYYSIRYKSDGQTKEEGIGWESEGKTPQFCSNLRGEIISNIRMGEKFHSVKEKRDIESAKKKAEESKAVKLAQGFESFLSIRTLKPRTEKDYKKFMDTAFKDWSKRRIKDINSDMVSDRHKELLDSVGKAQANQAFRFLRSLLNYCAAKYRDEDSSPLIKYNPVKILTETRQWATVNRRQTIIKNKDLPKWFKAVQGLKSSVVRDYLLTILLSGLRRNEALPLETKAIDLEERTITLLDTKNNKPFMIPIPNYLHKVLKARIKANVENTYIFPSRIKGRRITEPQSGINSVIKVSKVEFCSHDLRRLFVTTAEALDLSPFVIKRLVNHSVTGKDSDTTGGYIVSDLDRLRGPIQKIEDKILQLAKAKEPGKVVPIKTA